MGKYDDDDVKSMKEFFFRTKWKRETPFESNEW